MHQFVIKRLRDKVLSWFDHDRGKYELTIFNRHNLLLFAFNESSSGL